MAYNLRLVSQTLYRLKREYGRTVTLRKTDNANATYDPKTGRASAGAGQTDHEIKRVIVGQANILRDLVYDLAYIAAGKNFTEGAFFDQTKTALIFDRKEMRDRILDDGTILEVTRDDTIYIDGKQYDTVTIMPVDGNWGTIVVAKAVSNPGAKP